MANKVLISLILGSSLCLCWAISVQENTAPNVKLILPSGNGPLESNTLIPYRIEISDKEDGTSEYDEIPIYEAILSIKYVSDSTQVKDYLASDPEKNYRALSWMGRNACFTCHRAKDKLIGPSFSEIAKRYSEQPNIVPMLSQKIIKGSQGTWGDQIMPAQIHLEPEQLQEVVKWILLKGKVEDYNFSPGLQGAFRTREVIPGTAFGGAYILSAHYLDHGLTKNPHEGKFGEAVLVLYQD